MSGFIISGRLNTGHKFTREVNIVPVRGELIEENILQEAEYHLDMGWPDKRIGRRVTKADIEFYTLYITKTVENYHAAQCRCAKLWNGKTKRWQNFIDPPEPCNMEDPCHIPNKYVCSVHAEV